LLIFCLMCHSLLYPQFLPLPELQRHCSL
jgi:hypothetical protein